MTLLKKVGKMNKFVNNMGVIAILLFVLAIGYGIGINIDKLGSAASVANQVVTEATDEVSK